MYNRRYAEYLSGLVQGVPPLMNHRTPEDIVAPGRIDIPSTHQWLSPNSFTRQPVTDPWTRLFQYAPRSLIAQGLIIV